MAPISLQSKILYGPFFSRRLGRSFGVNLFRPQEKICSFDCIYCEYGRTSRPTLTPYRDDVYSVDEVLACVEQAFLKPRTIGTLTLSGHGEPTLHPEFDLIVAGIRSIITETRTETQLALFTNGTSTQDVRVQDACRLIDRVMVKLDAGDEESFQRINCPLTGYTFADLMAGLRQLPGLVLQSCLIAGEMGNIDGRPFLDWVERLGELHPQEVQIYSIERPTSERSIQRVDPGKLQEIQSELETRFSFNVRAFWRD